MKTKAKLTLAISVLSAAVLAAGVTSTFAWFTTRSSVKFDAGTLKVSTLSKLTIEGQRVVSGADGDDPQATTTLITAANGPLGAVSSQTGEHFFAETTLGKPADKYTAIDDQDAVTALKGAGNKYCDYLKYNFKISADASDDGPKDLYVGLASPTITGSKLGNWYRIAIYEYEDTALDDDNHTKLNAGFAGTYAASAGSDTVITAAGGTTDSAARTAVSALAANQGVGVKIKNNFQVNSQNSTAASVPASSMYVCVAVWMEGTADTGADSDQNGAGGDTIHLEFTFSLQNHA